MRCALLVALVASCGDPALCTSDFRIAIDATTIVTVDFDPVASGVQTPVEVDTSMSAGSQVVLEVLDSTGAIVSTTTGIVDIAGVAAFGNVTVPAPTASLRASATNVCGSGTATMKLSVLAGATCDLALVTAPDPSAYYAPLPVLDIATDIDPSTPGDQVIVSVSTRAGWHVELRERSMVIGDEIIATGTQTTPIAMTTATFRDGMTSMFATCSMPPISLTSPALFTFVDSIAPTCTIDPPVANGDALTIVGRSSDDDVEGEPASITVTPSGGTPLDAAATPMAMGQTSGAVAIPTGTTAVDVVFSTRDHAHNACATPAHFAL